MLLSDNTLNENYVRPQKRADTRDRQEMGHSLRRREGLGARPGCYGDSAAIPMVLSVQRGWTSSQELFLQTEGKEAAKRGLGSGEMETKRPSHLSTRQGPHQGPQTGAMVPMQILGTILAFMASTQGFRAPKAKKQGLRLSPQKWSPLFWAKLGSSAFLLIKAALCNSQNSLLTPSGDVSQL